MLKAVGILCILAGSTGLGVCMAKELEDRIEELLQLQKLTLRLRGEIRYMHRTLPEAFGSLAESCAPPFSDFFRQSALDLQGRNGRTAEELWRKNLKQYFSGLHISRQELAELEKLGGMLGCLDVEMQVSTLDYYLDQLKQSAEQAEQSAESRRKLYRYLGILSGAALAVLII